MTRGQAPLTTFAVVEAVALKRSTGEVVDISESIPLPVGIETGEKEHKEFNAGKQEHAC
jgi:hypothetical protein